MRSLQLTGSSHQLALGERVVHAYVKEDSGLAVWKLSNFMMCSFQAFLQELENRHFDV